MDIEYVDIVRDSFNHFTPSLFPYLTMEEYVDIVRESLYSIPIPLPWPWKNVLTF